MDEPRKILAGRYELGETIGRGGMAEVHIGYDRRLGRTVAIKVLRSDLARDPAFLNRFRREAQAAAALNHPAIVAVYDTGEEQVIEPTGHGASVPYIVMEYVEGHTLREMLRDGRPLPADEALAILVGVLSALEYSHRAGIVHRDIKPANVMITTAGAVKVMDFGIARAVADSAATMTQASAVVGTAQYLSPEQARGEQVDARSDLYSAGCLLFELLTGRPPFMADSMVAVAYQHVREEAPRPSVLNPSIPQVLDQIVYMALAKEREARYQTAAEFRADLEAVQRGTRVLAPPIGAAAPAMATQVLSPVQGGTAVMPASVPPWQSTGIGAPEEPGEEDEEPRSRKWLVIALAAVGALALVGIIVLIVLNGRSSQVEVPDVVGKTADVAEEMITQAGLVPAKESVVSTEVEAGLVVRTNPAANVRVAEGSTVTYFVSSGGTSSTVPDVSGMTPDVAERELEAAGFKPERSREDLDSLEQDRGRVARTEPEAQTAAAQGSTVTYYVSTGRAELLNLVSKTRDEAEQILDDLNLRPTFREEESDKPAGTVISTNPAPGQLVNRGDRITVVIAKAAEETPPTPTAPTTAVIPSNLAGMTYAAAVDALRAAGFQSFSRTDSPSETVPSGQVVSTNPSGGSTVRLDQTIYITVSSGSP
ncbi:MAG: Stk1 family PASTA domain-containing Ser/Thr kinase [Micrococcales bacterium]|nr:Stk1 family PASTA domain-containing Ser/Thr kinase [Micrococcales bacterium]